MASWTNLLLIAGGGAVGSVARYLITLAASGVPGGSTVLGTSLANLLGCAGIAAVMEISLTGEAISPQLSLALRVGLFGGLTTFSTFAAESVGLAGSGRNLALALYLTTNLVGGFATFWGVSALVRGWGG